MAFSATNFDTTASGSKGIPPGLHYTSSDALATIEGSGYFNTVQSLLPTGSRLNVYSSASTGGGAASLSMVNTAGVMTVGVKTTLA